MEAERRALRLLGEVQQFLQVNRYQGVLWFNHEAFEELLDWMLTIAVIAIVADDRQAPQAIVEHIIACYDVVTTLQQAEKASEYQVAKLLEAAKNGAWYRHRNASKSNRLTGRQ